MSEVSKKFFDESSRTCEWCGDPVTRRAAVAVRWHPPTVAHLRCYRTYLAIVRRATHAEDKSP